MFTTTPILLLSIWTLQGTGTQVNSTVFTRWPRDCQELIQQGNIYEGHYVVYSNAPSPNKITMIYCSQDDGMEPLPNKVHSRESARNCLDLLQSGMVNSGPNIIYPYPEHPTVPVLVFCDQETDGGGWTVIQNRIDGSEDFYRSWSEYSEGFGNIAEEHYLGNDIIAALTAQCVNELRVDLEDWDQKKTYAHYQTFHVDARYNYELQTTLYDGTAGDCLGHYFAGQAFSTFDADNDANEGNCAVSHHGAWWYVSCTPSNLNGGYCHDTDGVNDVVCMYWGSFSGGSLKASRMMVRPYSCTNSNNGRSYGILDAAGH